MPSNKSNKFPPEIIKHWPEVFKDIQVEAVPIKYIEAVLVHFDDGSTYEISLDDENELDHEDASDFVEETLETFFEEYEDVIEGIEFKLHTKKVIRDIKSQTKRFLRRNK